MAIVLLLIFLAGVLSLIGYLAILADSILGDYDFATSAEAVHKIAEIIKLRKGNFYDLGSARGNFIIKLAKLVPPINYYGVDNNLFRVLISRLKALFFGKQIKFLYENIFNTDISKADIVYIYLEKSLLPSLEKKLQLELNKGAIVITNANKFPFWQPQATYITHPQNPEKQKLFVYIKL